MPATAGAVDKSYRLTGPYTHDNLAIYLIHREGTDDSPVPLTLGEAMEQDLVKVIETGNVEELVLRNLGDREVFIQSGDIVKGGKQDRVLTVSMIVPPNSADIPIGAFCVEYGRWSGRGQEKATAFSMSTARLPSKAGKIAIVKRVQREIVPAGGCVAKATPSAVKGSERLGLGRVESDDLVETACREDLPDLIGQGAECELGVPVAEGLCGQEERQRVPGP